MSPKIRRLVKLLSRLPGVGEKTAQRYVLWLLTADEAVSRELGGELASLRDELGPCARCCNVAEIRDGTFGSGWLDVGLEYVFTRRDLFGGSAQAGSAGSGLGVANRFLAAAVGRF